MEIIKYISKRGVEREYVIYKGIKYTRNLNSENMSNHYFESPYKKNSLHRAIYEEHYGKIPKGHHIHHIDGDITNNNIENLHLLTNSEHIDIHNKNRKQETIDKISESVKKLWENGAYKSNKNIKLITYKGITKNLSEWSLCFGHSKSYICRITKEQNISQQEIIENLYDKGRFIRK